MRINPLLFFILLLFFNTPLFSQSPEQSSLITVETEEIKEMFVKKFQEWQTYQSSFREISRGRLRQGIIKYRKPHLLHVTYYNPDNSVNMEIFAGETKLYVHMNYANIVLEQDLTAGTLAEGETLSVGITQLDRLIENYNFNFIQSKTPVAILEESDAREFAAVKESSTAFHFLLTPKDKTTELENLEVWIDTRGQIRRSCMIRQGRKVLDMYYYNIEYDREMSKRDFLFDVPADTRVIKNSLMDLPVSEK